MALKMIKLVEDKCKQGEYLNGKQFALLSAYVMEVISNSDQIELKQKTEVIESIVSILKALRKK